MGQDKGWPPAEEFELFYREHLGDLVKYAVGWGAGWQDADEGAQEAMITVCRCWYRIRGNRAAYARRAMIRAILKIRRSRHDHNTSPVSDEDLPEHGFADRDLQSFEDDQWINQLLDRLPPDQRAVIEAFLAGKTFAAFAAELQSQKREADWRDDEEKEADLVRRAASVRKNFERALAKLRRELSNDPTEKGKETR